MFWGAVLLVSVAAASLVLSGIGAAVLGSGLTVLAAGFVGVLALKGVAKAGPYICNTLNELATSFSTIDSSKMKSAAKGMAYSALFLGSMLLAGAAVAAIGIGAVAGIGALVAGFGAGGGRFYRRYYRGRVERYGQIVQWHR